MFDTPNFIAVRRSANHGLLTVAGGNEPGRALDDAIALDARSVAFSFSTLPSGNPTAFAVTPRFASIFALAMSILPLNSAEPVNHRGVPAVNCWRSGAVPEISSVAGVRPKSLAAERNSIVPRRLKSFLF